MLFPLLLLPCGGVIVEVDVVLVEKVVNVHDGELRLVERGDRDGLVPEPVQGDQIK